MRVNTTTNMTVDGIEIDVQLSGRFIKGHPGRMHLANGDPGYPPEPDMIEDVTAKVCGVDFDLTDEQYQKAEEVLLDAAAECDDRPDHDDDRLEDE